MIDFSTAPDQPAFDRIDFEGINRAALAALLAILDRWLPDGRVEGREYVACNPRRSDRRPGSFKINLVTGKWADFATGDKGGDVISLAASAWAIGARTRLPTGCPETLPRIANSKTDWRCKFCDFKEPCWAGTESPAGLAQPDWLAK